MTIDKIWQSLEADSALVSKAGWLTQFALPHAGQPLLVGLERATGVRALLLPVQKGVVPPRRDWPECRGLEVFTVAFGTQPHLGVRLRDQTCADVFTALAEDVAQRVGGAAGIKEAATTFLDRLCRWQQFLSASRVELSLEAQRGLWGELYFLSSHLLPTLGSHESVSSWKGGARAHQDFQFQLGAIEVKTTAAKQPQSVRITSERQLDDTGVGALFLHIVVVDEREVPAGGTAPGEGLPGMIDGLRKKMTNTPDVLAKFNDSLLESGWLDSQINRYEARRWTVRAEQTFQVGKGFARLIEGDLPKGVGDVSYSLSLSACTQFSTKVSKMLNMLVGTKTA